MDQSDDDPFAPKPGDESGTSGSGSEELSASHDTGSEGGQSDDDSDFEGFDEGSAEEAVPFAFDQRIVNATNETEDEDTSENTGPSDINMDDPDSDIRSDASNTGDSELDGAISKSSDDEPRPRKKRKSQDIDRAALEEMFAADRKSMVASITEATKADVAKGKAVKQQRAAFDGLLNTRIRMQKALVATNSMSPTASARKDLPDVDANIIEAAESAALKLLDSLQALRSSFNKSHTETMAKPQEMARLTASISNSDIHASLQASSTAYRPQRRATLTRWAEKTELPATRPSLRGKAVSENQPLAVSLDNQLAPANMPRLVERTQLPRSCAPLQAAAAAGHAVPAPDPAVYDDADWYAQLLRDLIDAKAAAGAAPIVRADDVEAARRAADATAAAAKRTRPRPRGPQASKGRTMRYHVHEKLQNFVARETEPGPGWWGERRVDELFGSLLGKRVRGGLEEGAGSASDSGEEDSGEKGLRLFQSS